jgi:hypothetical protein
MGKGERGKRAGGGAGAVEVEVVRYVLRAMRADLFVEAQELGAW